MLLIVLDDFAVTTARIFLTYLASDPQMRGNKQRIAEITNSDYEVNNSCL